MTSHFVRPVRIATLVVVAGALGMVAAAPASQAATPTGATAYAATSSQLNGVIGWDGIQP